MRRLGVSSAVWLIGSITTATTVSAEVPLADDHAWSVAAPRELAVDAGLAFGAPTLLPTGLVRGIGAGILYAPCLGPIAFGARASWGTATESSAAWAVSHDDVRVRAIVAVQHTAGRGTFGLRLGAGGAMVHEARTRHQGGRAGLAGDDLAMSATAVMPLATLEATIALQIAGAFSLSIAAGPSTIVYAGAVDVGWSGEIGVAWQP
jgi:hypothetical protein